MEQGMKEKTAFNMNVIGEQVKKYRTMMILVSFIIVSIGLFFSIFWEYDETSYSALSDVMYLACYLFLMGLSLIVAILLILSKPLKIKTHTLAVALHIYVFLLIAWSTLIAVLDLEIGAAPMLYLIVMTALAGLFVVEPIYYCGLAFISFGIVMGFSGFKHYAFFNGEFGLDDIVSLFIYLVVIGATSFRQFNITIKEHKFQKELLKLTYYDQLTELLNERSYLETIADIQKQIEENKVDKFAVILFDVNNLKATNDAHGHRFGCHLVVTCGKTLPTLFSSDKSKLFHIGGDEFLAIVCGEDLDNFDELTKRLVDTLEYSLITYEDKELIFSVAMGYAMYQDGDRYQDVLQRADNAMYINKKYVKEKYGIKGR